MVVFLENFYDFHCVPNDRAPNGYQYISPNFTFPCDGAVTQWKIGTEDQNNEQVYLQIWRPTETDYTRVAETVYTLGVCDYQNIWYHDYCRLLLREYHD